MTRTRLLLGLLLAAVVLNAIVFTVATQYAASMLGYQKELGPGIATVAGLHLYAPWSWLSWVSDFGPYAPAIFRTVKLIGWSVLLGTFVPLLIALFSRKKAPSTSHGSATWGDKRTLKRAGLLTGKGIVLCQTNDARYTPGDRPGEWRMDRPGQLITHDGPEHVIAFAPTRSGKGIGTVIPTLLNWKASALVYDIKKELWTRTAGWRRQFSRCWRFEPSRPLRGDLDVLGSRLILAGDLAYGGFEGLVVVSQRRRQGALVRVFEDRRERQACAFGRERAGLEELPGLDFDSPALNPRSTLDPTLNLSGDTGGAHWPTSTPKASATPASAVARRRSARQWIRHE
jgi:hypothetical protein